MLYAFLDIKPDPLPPYPFYFRICDTSMYSCSIDIDKYIEVDLCELFLKMYEAKFGDEAQAGRFYFQINFSALDFYNKLSEASFINNLPCNCDIDVIEYSSGFFKDMLKVYLRAHKVIKRS